MFVNSSTGAKGSQRILNIVILLVLGSFLCVSLISSNMWRFLPEFNDLETTFSLSSIFQILLFSLFVGGGLYYIFKKRNAFILTGVVVMFVFCFFSSYSLVVSHRVNSIISYIGPLAIDEVSFTDDLVITKTSFGYRFSNSDKSVQFLNDIFLLGTHSKDINQKLVDLGECSQKSEDLCWEIDVAWP